MRTYPIIGIILASLLTTACSKEPERPLERRKLLNRLKDARPAGRIVAIRGLAADADREELVAIVRAADGAPEEVRVEVARALGASKRPEAVDFLGAMVVTGATTREDRSDLVRAEAIGGLAKQGGPKASAYLVRAWARGGPASRAAVAQAGADVLGRAVSAETASRRTELLAAANDGPPPARAAALEELGDHGTPEVVALIDAALVSEEPAVAASAALGLAHADAKTLVPHLAREVGAGRPLVVAAAARALSVLGADHARPQLLTALALARPGEAGALLDALETLTPDDELRAAACKAALALAERETAVHALRLAGPACPVPATLPETPPELTVARLALLTERRTKDTALAARARALLGHADAGLAIAAAEYLTALGEPADGPRLLAAAESQHKTSVEAWLVRRREVEAGRLATRLRDEESRRQFEHLVDDPSKLERPETKLEALIAKRRSASESATFEPRPRAVEFLVAAGTGAARLGADVAPLVESLLNDEQARLPVAAVALVEAAGADAEPLRERCRAHEDVAVRVEMAVADLAAQRAGAVERATALVGLAEPETTARLVAALAPHAAAAREALLLVARGSGAAVAPAVRALGTLPGDDVTELLVTRVLGPGGQGADEAAEALARRDGAAATKGLTIAATHPAPGVQVHALDALAARRACGPVSLVALTAAFDRQVRAAADRFAAACGTTSPTTPK